MQQITVMKISFHSLIIGLSVCLLTGCKNSSPENNIIAVSIEPVRNLVEILAGDDFDVVTILDKGSNPETFNPAMSKRAAAEKSRLYFTLGVFPFEKDMDLSNNMINITTGIKHLHGTHSHRDKDGCNHNEDPHMWTSIKNMMVITDNITKVLCDENGANKDKYISRRDSLIELLQNIDHEFCNRLSTANTRSFAIWHPSLGYYARDYNLKQIAVGDENKEISPMRIKDLIAKAKCDSVNVFFFQNEYDSRQAEILNKQLGSRMIPIDLLSYDWISQLKIITDELSR